ncbi:hypothetical protein [Kineosporia sp. NBRC 101731]|uniref:hypothetical protein n=1 Tax=Kineosporia sp. NBRC 101731 TaxID=3032199 RepID=UPI0024A3D968|nr:hypothetical protein [Kineosporia sp. NBRC 101731]GLY27035.1 hypothetical protein Kisp02_04000 [Kineosporia sp. NBRC 101731]
MQQHAVIRLAGLAAVSVVVAGGLLAVPAQAAAPGSTTELVLPVDAAPGTGTPNGDQKNPAVTPNGRYIAFPSTATNIDRNLQDTNNGWDVFVRDTKTGITTMVSTTSGGGSSADRDSPQIDISSNGRYVAFSSWATDLVAGDDLSYRGDVFFQDLKTGRTTKISVGVSGTPDSGGGDSPSISADGSRVAFFSSADDLVPGDTNGLGDVFVWKRSTGRISRVSVTSSGRQATSAPDLRRPDSIDPQISGDGRTVVFSSGAANLVPGDTNRLTDVFAHSLTTGKTRRVSIGPGGGQITGGVASQGLGAGQPTVSHNGSVVTYNGFALLGLISPEPARQIGRGYVHDRTTGKTRLAAVTRSGRAPTEASGEATISPDGRFVTFSSFAGDLVANDTNGGYDVFRRDLKTGSTRRVSVSSTGTQANAWSGGHGLAISRGGSTVVFTSRASNLTPVPLYDRDNLFRYRR